MAWDSLSARAHIQNFSDANASNIEHHWGYADRIVPCKNDAGSCEYLDLAYHAHDLSMLYTGIFWSSILGILLVWGIARRIFHPSHSGSSHHHHHQDVATPAKAESQQASGTGRVRALGGVERVRRSIASLSRRHLLPDFSPRILGHVTRLQVAVLFILAAYLALLSFLGMVYKTWITPVKSSPGLHNTRTSLGPFADRLGVLAYALTPLSVLLASRESLLSLLTGVPYQSFLFLHRWVGYIILLQSAVHTLGWVVVEARLYQPQPATWASLAAETYIQWGFAALGLLVLLGLLATPWGIRLTGYEVFRKAHYVLAMVYMGAAIAHWQQLQCFLVPGLLLWGCDRFGRLVRTALLHYQWLPARSQWGFDAAQARMTYWADDDHRGDGDVVRLDFEHAQQPWMVGQHFYLCFPEGSIWQSHPMTPLSLPMADSTTGKVRHSYVIRAKKGETKKMALLAAKKIAACSSSTERQPATKHEKDDENGFGGRGRYEVTTPVILTGPYGVDMVGSLTSETNVLCIAGGTGITFVLPVLLSLTREHAVPGRKIELVWAVRRDMDVKWVEEELDEIKRCSHGVHIDVFVTREKAPDHPSASVMSGSSSDAGGRTSGCDPCGCNDVSHHHPANVDDVPAARRPRLDEIVRSFVRSVAQGSTVVYASGPGGMIGDLREAVAACNEAGKVWAGDGMGDVRLVCDDRLE